MATIHTGSVLERSVLKEGHIFLVADRGGDIKAMNVEGHGLYYRDVRHLSLFELDITGTRLTLLSEAGELNFLSNLEFTNDVLLGQKGEQLAAPRTISVRRQRFLHGSLHERLEFCNYNPRPIRLVARLTFGADFRDMFEVRGFEVQQDRRGAVDPPRELDNGGMVLQFRGTDGLERRTYLVFDPRPDHTEIVFAQMRRRERPEDREWDQRDEGAVVPPIAAAEFHVDLPPLGSRSISISITLESSTHAASVRHPTVLTDARRGEVLDWAFANIRASYADWIATSTLIETDHDHFDQILDRARLDLRMLTEDFQGHSVPTAGIPWFAVPFGRDSLITSMQTLLLQPGIARGTLGFLAEHQGSTVNQRRGEEPGKILHEVRPGAVARIADSLYYGSIDATPLFVAALGEYVSWTGDLEFARLLLPSAEAALAWIDAYGDLDGDGFVEGQRDLPSGALGSQGWKDSPDSISYSSGERASSPIALAEVHAYVFAAHRHMARIYGQLGQPDAQLEQEQRAERARALFVDKLAMRNAEGQFWAMGLDADKRPIDTVTTNVGHALWAGLLRDADAQAAVQRLMAQDMLCGWGLRTLSSRAASFNPISYHNGSVWPHDNAIVALGMKRAGADEAACEVASQIFEAGLRFPGSRLPELWCGFDRDRLFDSNPSQYPVGCSPQAWAAGSAFMLLQAVLGIEADAFESVVRLRPVLPPWLGRICVRRLRVAGSQIDFDVVRHEHRLHVDVIDHGGLRVETSQPLH